VVVVDWKNSATAAPQNLLHLAECTCRKSCVVCCDVLRGIPFCSAAPTPLPQHRKIKQIAPAQKFAWWAAMRPLLKVRHRRKPCHALR